MSNWPKLGWSECLVWGIKRRGDICCWSGQHCPIPSVMGWIVSPPPRIKWLCLEISLYRWSSQDEVFGVDPNPIQLVSLHKEGIKMQRQTHSMERWRENTGRIDTYKLRDKNGSQKLGGRPGKDSPSKDPPCPHLDFRLLYSRTETMNFCPKPPSWWYSVTAALRN